MAAAITDTQGIIAIAAAAVAVVALIGCAALAIARAPAARARSARDRASGEQRDLVGHAARMQEAFEALREYVEESRCASTGAWRAPRRRCAGRSRTARWCATTPTTSCPGTSRCRSRCSTTTRSGIVLSCIHHRDQARVYAKQVHDGRGELELSPEEAEAVRLALAPGRRGEPMSPSSTPA